VALEKGRDQRRASETGRPGFLKTHFERQLLAKLSQADAILFDGTFWSNEDFEKSGIGQLLDEI
jgi:hypothetical protein